MKDTEILKRENRKNDDVQWSGLKGSDSEAGAALLMVLILTAISLAFTAALIFMVTTGAQVTGGQKRFETALEAGKGGLDVMEQMVEARGDPNIPLTNFALPAEFSTAINCLAEKLNKPTYNTDGTLNWNPLCETSLAIDSTDNTTYDMFFDLGENPLDPATLYSVYAKIVDTVDGNSGPSSGLVKTGVVLTNSGEVTVMSVPYLYTVELLAQNNLNPVERARLSTLHLY